jgi:hypothetical protein
LKPGRTAASLHVAHHPDRDQNDSDYRDSQRLAPHRSAPAQNAGTAWLCTRTDCPFSSPARPERRFAPVRHVRQDAQNGTSWAARETGPARAGRTRSTSARRACCRSTVKSTDSWGRGPRCRGRVAIHFRRHPPQLSERWTDRRGDTTKGPRAHPRSLPPAASPRFSSPGRHLTSERAPGRQRRRMPLGRRG